MKSELEQIVISKKRTTISEITEEQKTSFSLEKVVVSPFHTYWCIFINLVFGIVGLVGLLLVLPVLALLIYLDSPGPIFYMQERLGYKGSIFRMYKLRTMHTDTRGTTNLVRTAKQDSRVTRVGKWLRITHLDELPQVLNILRGDMNLIGPRPEQPHIAARIEEAIPLYRTRLHIKPGLTGWAQVMYHYTNTERGDVIKLKHDLYYIINRSPLLDIKIILKTVLEVLFGRGR